MTRGWTAMLPGTRMARAVFMVSLVALASCEDCGTDLASNEKGGTISVTPSPAAVQIPQGGSANVTMTVGRFGFNGAVVMTVITPPPGIQTDFTPTYGVSAGATTTTMIVSAANDAPYEFDDAGAPVAKKLVVQAAMEGGGVQFRTIDVTVLPSSQAGITINATPGAYIVAPGESVDGTVALARLANYTGRVTFAVEGLPEGVTATVTPTSTANSHVLRISATSGATTFTTPRQVTIRATGEGLSRAATTTFSLVVNRPSFSMSLSDNLAGITAGTAREFRVNLTRNGGLTGPIRLSVEANLPPGMTATLDPAEVIDVVSFLNVGTTTAVPPGDYPITVRATGPAGTTPQSAVLTIRVHPNPGTYSLTIPGATVAQGSRTSVPVTIDRAGGFTDAIRLSVAPINLGIGLPPGMTATVPAEIVSGNAAVEVTTTSATPVGTYTLVLTGRSDRVANVVQTFTVTVTEARRVASVTLLNTNGAPFGAPTLTAGTSAQIVPVVRDQNGQIMTGERVSFESNATGTASVTTDGLVTAHTAGSAKITVRSQSTPTVFAEATITVVAPLSNVARIELEPDNAEITAPASQQYRVMFYNAAGARISVESGGTLQFVSSTPAVANFNPDINITPGLATGRAPGVTTIVARYLRNGSFVVQDATTLTVYAEGSANHVGNMTISTANNNTRELRRGTANALLFQVLIRSPGNQPITSGVTPTFTVPNGITITRTSDTSAYFYTMTADPGMPLGNFTLRYDLMGAGGEITMTIVP